MFKTDHVLLENPREAIKNKFNKIVFSRYAFCWLIIKKWKCGTDIFNFDFYLDFFILNLNILQV